MSSPVPRFLGMSDIGESYTNSVGKILFNLINMTRSIQGDPPKSQASIDEEKELDALIANISMEYWHCYRGNSDKSETKATERVKDLILSFIAKNYE